MLGEPGKMKKILITGKNSYIGTSFERWFDGSENYLIHTLDVRSDVWKNQTFSSYDAIFHVAGIAHIKETSKNQDLYYKVNRDLTYDIASKAKNDGVSQFIFLSSMSVYGLDRGEITKTTPLQPTSAYGKSKLEAEGLINSLKSESFKVAIVRPPMVYGKDCRGNYTALAKLAVKTPIFPSIENQRSMIYIDHLSEFIKQLIDNQCSGLYLPQNADYVKTIEMVRLIAESHGKNILMTTLFNPLIKLFNIKIVNKVFGDLIYDQKIANNIGIISFEESIKRTEN